MATIETLRQRSITQPSDSSGEYLLAPRSLKEAVDIAIPVAQIYQDTNQALKEAASDAYTQALRDNRALGDFPTMRAKLRFIQSRLGLPDEKIAGLLGITANQVVRQDLRARRKNEIGKFKDRLNNGFTVASILARESGEYPGVKIDRKISLMLPSGNLSGFSVLKAMEAGFGNIGVAIALESARHKQEIMGYQRGNW